MNVWTQLPFRLPMMHDQQSMTLCWVSFSGWGGEHVSVVFYYIRVQYLNKRQWRTKVNILRLTVGYLNLTINRRTQKPELEIGTDGSSQPRQNAQVKGYRHGFGPPGRGWSGVWPGPYPNETILGVWFRTSGMLPRPVADTWYTYIPITSTIHTSSITDTNPHMVLLFWAHLISRLNFF